MKLKNYTPHELRIILGEKELVLPSEGIARVEQTEEFLFSIDGVPILKPEYGPITGLPEPEPGVYVVVSLVVAQAAAQERRRDDLLYPNTGPGDRGAVRDDQGKIIGVKSLLKL